MKITGIRTIVVGNPWKNWLFVKLATDEGIEGLGEATAGLHTKPVEAAVHEVTHLCLGADPRDTGMLFDSVKKALFLSEDGVVAAALSGINMACWDIIGKAAGQPLYRLLGGRARPRLRAYANGWYQGARDPVFFAEHAAKVAAMGYTALKFDPFGNAYQFLDAKEERLSMQIVKAVRAAVGEDVDLLIEAHDRFSIPTAIRLGRLLEEFRPFWYETPVMSTDIRATNQVARAVKIPVASGERFTTVRQIAELVEERVVSIVQPETLYIGGVNGMLDACATAGAFGAWAAPHNAQSPFTTGVNTHIGIAVPNVLIQECFDDFHVSWAAEVLSGFPKVVDGYLEPSDEPGIGVSLNEKEAAKHPYSEKNFLRLFESGWEKRRIS